MTVTFKVSRFDPGVERETHFVSYEVDVVKGMSVLEGLFYILENLDGSLAFRYSCRGAVCGSCAMYINGKPRLACQTLIASLRGKTISIEPLPHLPVIKDLVADMASFFEKYQKVKPFLINETPAPAKERIQPPAERQKIDEMVKCILCGSCYSSCPMASSNGNFLGPAALTKSYRFFADSRDINRKERLELASSEEGIWRCHTAFACAEACPKEIVPAYSIQKLKGAVVKRMLSNPLALGNTSAPKKPNPGK